MKEEKTGLIAATEKPNTQASLSADLSALGIRTGMSLIIHTSLSAIGWVCGGPVALILALEGLLTPWGSLVMPTHSGDLSDPAQWLHPPVPESWWETIRSQMPAFNPALTPTRGMGIVPEIFRGQFGVLRSRHPQLSFAAWGRHKRKITAAHSLDFSLGEGSPLARLYELDAYVLLLGVGHGNNTSLHLAEYRANFPAKRVIDQYAPVLEKGRRVWKRIKDIDFSDEDFERLGDDFEREHIVRLGKIGNAQARLFKQRELVDFALQWLEAHRH